MAAKKPVKRSRPVPLWPADLDPEERPCWVQAQLGWMARTVTYHLLQEYSVYATTLCNHYYQQRFDDIVLVQGFDPLGDKLHMQLVLPLGQSHRDKRYRAVMRRRCCTACLKGLYATLPDTYHVLLHPGVHRG